MIWDDPEFLAIFRPLLNDTMAAGTRKAQGAQPELALKINRSGALWGGDLAMAASRVCTSLYTDHIEGMIAAYDEALAHLGTEESEADLDELERRAIAALASRDPMCESLLAGLPFEGSTVGLRDQAKAQIRMKAEGVLRRRIALGRARLKYRKRKLTIAERAVFISHDSADADLAAHLKTVLKAALGDDVDVFVSSDLESLRPGEDWFRQITEKLKTSRTTLALITPNSLRNPWLPWEVGTADGRERRVIPLSARGADFDGVPRPLNRNQGCDLRRRERVLQLLETIRADLELAPSEFDGVALDGLLREASRPVGLSELSADSLHLARVINAQSGDALVGSKETLFEFEPLRIAAGLDLEGMRTAVGGLSAKAMIKTHVRMGSADPRSVAPTAEFFLAMGAIDGDSDPRRDARVIASEALRDGDTVAPVRPIAERRGWSPRRTNVALYALEREVDGCLKGKAMSPPFAYEGLFITPELRAFAARGFE